SIYLPFGLMTIYAASKPNIEETPKPIAPPSGVQLETIIAATAKTIAGINNLFPYFCEPSLPCSSLTSIIFLITTCLQSVSIPITMINIPLITLGIYGPAINKMANKIQNKAVPYFLIFVDAFNTRYAV